MNHEYTTRNLYTNEILNKFFYWILIRFEVIKWKQSLNENYERRSYDWLFKMGAYRIFNINRQNMVLLMICLDLFAIEF